LGAAAAQHGSSRRSRPAPKNSSATTSPPPDVHLSHQQLDHLDALSRPTLGFPADVMREASVVSGFYGAQPPDIDDPRAEAVRRTTTTTSAHQH
jgi:hypothetical protein